MRTVDALVCLRARPAAARAAARPAARRRARSWSGRCGWASAAPTTTSSRASTRFSNTRGSWATSSPSSCVEPAARPRGRRESASSTPTSPAAPASPAATASPTAACGIAVLGVHRDGGMAGLLAVPAGNLVPAPGLTPDQCAAVEFLAIGAHAVRRGAVSARDRVLVVGAGPIGLGVALFARRAGAAVVVLDRDTEPLGDRSRHHRRRCRAARCRPDRLGAPRRRRVRRRSSTPPATRGRWRGASTTSRTAAAACWSAW